MIHLIFPNVPQSSQTESLGFHCCLNVEMCFFWDDGRQVACELNGITLDRKGSCWSLQTLTSKCQPETVPVEVGIPGKTEKEQKPWQILRFLFRVVIFLVGL